MSAPVAVVTSYRPPTRTQRGATVTVSCPLGCVERDRWRRPVLDENGDPIPLMHQHGIGAAGGQPVLGSRVAHCRDARGTYELVDKLGLVPALLKIDEGVLS